MKNSKTDTEHISFLTKRGIIEARDNNKHIILAWIPGHSDIKGNTRADKVANIGRILKIPAEVKINKDNYPKKEIWYNWTQTYKDYLRKEETFYSKIASQLTKFPTLNFHSYKNRTNRYP